MSNLQSAYLVPIIERHAGELFAATVNLARWLESALDCYPELGGRTRAEIVADCAAAYELLARIVAEAEEEA